MRGYYALGFYNVVLVKDKLMRLVYDRSLSPKRFLDSIVYPSLTILRWGDVEE